jgi:glucosamine 6-phosphate synthetase-like amidotransferase/phosphosugar isomerase protein
VIWVGNKGSKKFSTVAVPESTAITQPAAEAVAMQLVALALAVNKGLDAGNFRHIGKVVRVE